MERQPPPPHRVNVDPVPSFVRSHQVRERLRGGSLLSSVDESIRLHHLLSKDLFPARLGGVHPPHICVHKKLLSHYRTRKLALLTPSSFHVDSIEILTTKVCTPTATVVETRGGTPKKQNKSGIDSRVGLRQTLSLSSVGAQSYPRWKRVSI